MLNHNVLRHKCRKAAGNPRSPQRIAATPASDNVWLMRKRRKRGAVKEKEELKEKEEERVLEHM